MDRVTPEMQAAYCEWDAPNMPAGNEVKMPRLLGLMRTAFFAGWIACRDAGSAMSTAPKHRDCPECGKRFTQRRIDHHLATVHNIR